jgi:putative oxidoreductase
MPSLIGFTAEGRQAGSLTMNGVVLAGRILLSAMFIFSGAMKYIDVPGTASHIAEKGLPVPEFLAIATGTFEVIAGLAILIGWQTRLASWALAGFCILAGLLFHNFWAYEGQEQVAQMSNFLKNVTIAGGFLILSVYGPGRYAVGGHRRETGEIISGRGLHIA